MRDKFSLINRQRGLTLLEIMIALLIGVFMIGALLTIVQSNRTAFVDQNKLSQLQDNERIALTLMTDVIQSMGYIPDPVTTNAVNTLPVDASGPFAAGQSVVGTYSATAPGDAVSVRYLTTNADGILNCSGLPNSGANQIYVNTFSVINGQLVCTVNYNTQYTLVDKVTNLAVLYGVNTSGSVSNNVDTYLNASQVTTGNYWSNVNSVTVQITFTNPLYVATVSNGQPATITIQRVITAMNQSGLLL